MSGTMRVIKYLEPATALEGKQAQKTLARGMFVGLDEMHDALVFFDEGASSVPATKFSEILLAYGISPSVIDSLGAKYSSADKSLIDYVALFDSVLDKTAGLVAASFFRESQIILRRN